MESNYFQKNIESLKIEESKNQIEHIFFQSVSYIQRFLNQTNQLIPRVSDVGLGQDAITMGSMLRLYGGAFFPTEIRGKWRSINFNPLNFEVQMMYPRA